MRVDLDDVNFEELARCTEDFNGAQMKAVAVFNLTVLLCIMIYDIP